MNEENKFLLKINKLKKAGIKWNFWFQENNLTNNFFGLLVSKPKNGLKNLIFNYLWLKFSYNLVPAFLAFKMLQASILLSILP